MIYYNESYNIYVRNHNMAFCAIHGCGQKLVHPGKLTWNQLAPWTRTSVYTSLVLFLDVSSNLWTPCHFSGLVNHVSSPSFSLNTIIAHVNTERHICKIVKVFPVYIMKQIRNWGIVNTSTILKNRKSPQLPIVEDHWHEPCIILDSSVMSPQWKICHCQKDLILSCFENPPVDTVPVALLEVPQKYLSFSPWGEKGIDVNKNKYGWY